MRSPVESPHFPDMDRLRSTAAALRQQLDQGRITHQDMEAALQEVTANDAEGYEWGMASDWSKGGALSLFRRLPGGAPEFLGDDSLFAYYPASGAPPAAPQYHDPAAPPHDPYDDMASQGCGDPSSPPTEFYDSVEPPVDGLPEEPEGQGLLESLWDRKILMLLVLGAAGVLVWMMFFRSPDQTDDPVETAEPDSSAPGLDVQEEAAVPTEPSTARILVDPPSVALPEGFVSAWGGFLNSAVDGDVDSASRWLSPEALDQMSRLDILLLSTSWSGAKVLGLKANPTVPNTDEWARGHISAGVYFLDPEAELPAAAPNAEILQRLKANSLCAFVVFRQPDEALDEWRLDEWPPLTRDCG